MTTTVKSTRRKRTRSNHRKTHKYVISTRHLEQQSIRDNFYMWANYKWIKEVPKTLPKEMRYIRPLDNFSIIQEETYKNVVVLPVNFIICIHRYSI